MTASAKGQKARDFFDAIYEKYPATYKHENDRISHLLRCYRSSTWEDGLSSKVQFCGVRRIERYSDVLNYEFYYRTEGVYGDCVTVIISYDSVETDDKGNDNYCLRLTAETDFSDYHRAGGALYQLIGDAISWHEKSGFQIGFVK